MSRFSVIKWFRNVSIAKKLYFTVGIMACLILVELVALFFAINTLSSVRAYVGGEGLWSKAQKDAVYQLKQYTRSRDEQDYRAFEEFMKVPLGDKKARVQLDMDTPNLAIARQGLLEGRNHPNDIDGMIGLFSNFRDIHYISKAISIWSAADSNMVSLLDLAGVIHERVRSGAATEEELTLLARKIDPINEKLTVLEDDFSYTLGEGSRWLENLIMSLLFGVALTVEITGLLLAISVSRRITRSLREIIKVAEEIAKGDFSARTRTYSEDEIGTLATSINKMAEDLEKNVNFSRLSEASLAHQTVLYKNLLRAQSELGEGVAITEGQKFIYVNEALSNIYGYSKEELLAMPSFLDIIVAEERAPLASRLQERFAGSQDLPYTGETSVTHKDGRIVHIAYALKMFSQGERRQIFSIIRDITEERKIERSLERSREQLSAAQQLAHIGSWEWDLRDNSLNWSDELYRIYGIQKNGSNINYDEAFAMTHSADREMMRAVIEESKRTHKPFNFYHRIILKDRSVKTLHARGEVIVNSSGEAVRIVGTDQDVTERIFEEELEKLAIAATKSYNSVIIADSKGKIEWVNEGFIKLTGYTLEDIRNTHGELLRKGRKTGLSQETDFHHYVVREKKPVTYESKNYTKNGSEYWVITTLTPVLNESGEVQRIIAIDSDITTRKKMEEDLINANRIAEHSLMKGNKALDELLKAKRQVEESMKVKEQFLANMSHEIRTPMNAIVGFTDLILKTPMNQEQKQYVDAIKTSGENLIVIINDILDFSKIQSGRITFEQIHFSLSQLIGNLSEMMLPRSTGKGIQLSTNIASNISDSLIGDPTRLNQVLLNLVGNAIKFTETGEVSIAVKLILEEEESEQLEFSISDTGIGIPEEKLQYIFDEFTQATSDTTRKYGGSGLGLTIVKQLVELQGGTVSVSSGVGKGSVFSFRLIFRKGPERGVEQEPGLFKEEEVLPVEGLQVLLVEDNVLNQVLAKKVLSDWKWNVEVAENGLVAIKKLEQRDFDIVLMDIQLPEMDGYQATKYIRSHMPKPKCDVPIMAMTAHAISSEEEKCYEAGMHGYISKPFNQNVLYSRIMAVLRSNGKHLPQVEKPAPLSQENLNTMKHTDLSYLKQLSNGSNKFMAEMISLFIEQTPGSIEKMEKHLRNREWPLLRGVAHKMKPSVAFVGLKEIESDIRSVEDSAANESNLDSIPEKIGKIKNVCSEAIRELKEELDHYV